MLKLLLSFSALVAVVTAGHPRHAFDRVERRNVNNIGYSSTLIERDNIQAVAGHSRKQASYGSPYLNNNTQGKSKFASCKE